MPEPSSHNGVRLAANGSIRTAATHVQNFPGLL
jgi:hypothetical protein